MSSKWVYKLKLKNYYTFNGITDDVIDPRVWISGHNRKHGRPLEKEISHSLLMTLKGLKLSFKYLSLVSKSLYPI